MVIVTFLYKAFQYVFLSLLSLFAGKVVLDTLKKEGFNDFSLHTGLIRFTSPRFAAFSFLWWTVFKYFFLYPKKKKERVAFHVLATILMLLLIIAISKK